MLKILQSKKIAAVVLGLVLLSLIALTILAVRFFVNMSWTEQMDVFLDGKYSIDGGDWKPINHDAEIKDTFRVAVFKGKATESTQYLKNITVSSKNVWYTLKDSKGELLAENAPIDVNEAYKSYIDNKYYEEFGEEKLDFEGFKSKYFGLSYFQVSLTDTPGYGTRELYMEFDGKKVIPQDEELTLEVYYPYDRPLAEFNDCFSCLLSESNGNYAKFFYSTPLTVLFELICFFGLFFFPIAGFILGKIDYSYLAFGMLCFCWGLFMLVRSVSGFMNLWITDSTVCMLIEKLCNYALIISILFYLKSNLKTDFARAVGNILGVIYFIVVAVATVLHFSNVIDMHASSPYVFIYTAFSSTAILVLMITECRSNKIMVFQLISWIPLIVTVIIDAVDHYVHFTSVDFYVFGLAATMIYQLVRSVGRLRKQYLDAIRFQQMQKELYEAKVSVMVSQIQPHFMYNALSSIAMLCKLDPDTAYQATITFSQYLRSNMDSLKQTNPVPFEQELEHLKKYLYIEKLRFGKKLNIEYDIQATDFELPQLSIQPLAENAVKHGISKKRGGGTLTIATRETENAYEVIVSDDGVGFDPDVKKDDGRSHVGMENIKRRLKEMCGADVVIESKIGEGTVAKVIIPKGENV
jgi:sensor histidine kinase YesM